MRSIASPQRFSRFAFKSMARFQVNVVTRMRSSFPLKTSDARCPARCMRTTVFPVPAPRSTRTGPFAWDRGLVRQHIRYEC